MIRVPLTPFWGEVQTNGWYWFQSDVGRRAGLCSVCILAIMEVPSINCRCNLYTTGRSTRGILDD